MHTTTPQTPTQKTPFNSLHTPSFMGIDAGLSGALAIYTPASFDSEYMLQIADMPITPKVKGKKSEVDAIGLADLISKIEPSIHLHTALLETPHSMPRDGHVGAFSFGRGLGVIQGVLAANGVNTIATLPAVWKSQLRLSSDKQKSLDMATKLFPNQARLFARKKDDGRAEAALLAYLAAKTFGGITVK